MKEAKSRKNESKRTRCVSSRCNPDGHVTASQAQQPNPAELMATWCDLFTNLVAATWICGAISMGIHEEAPAYIAIIWAGVMIFSVGLPGMLACIAFDSVKTEFGEVLPIYYHSKSLFSGGIQSAWQRCRDHCSLGMLMTVYLSFIILIGNLICLFNPDAFILSIVGMIFLSLLGGFTIVGRIAIAVIRTTHRVRQVL